MMEAAHIARAVTDVFLERRCPVCGRALRSREERLCLFCAGDLPLTYYWTQPRNAMADRFNARFTGDDISYYIYAAALFFYRSEAGYAEIPKALKYHADYRLGRHYARMLGRRLAESEAFRDVDLVVPVPLHPLRRWRRGYNQAEVLAREVAAALGARLGKGFLRRRRYTRTQTRLHGEAKARNVDAAFVLTRRARRKGLAAHHVLLLDDVFTTGATLGACFRALLPLCPSARLSVATLAVVKE